MVAHPTGSRRADFSASRSKGQGTADKRHRLLDRSAEVRGGHRKLSPALRRPCARDRRRARRALARGGLQPRGDAGEGRHPRLLARRHRARIARLRGAPPRAPRSLRRDRRRRRVEGHRTRMGACRPAAHSRSRPARTAGRPLRRAVDGRRLPGSGVRRHPCPRRRVPRAAPARVGSAPLRRRHLRRIPPVRPRFHVAGERRRRAASRAARPARCCIARWDATTPRGGAMRGASSRGRASIRSRRRLRAACRLASTRWSKSHALRAALLHFRYGAPPGR